MLLDTRSVVDGSVNIFYLEHSSISGYISDVYKLYKNDYLENIIVTNTIDGDYDPKYLWYCDAIRFMSSLIYENVSFRYAYENEFEDSEIENFYYALRKYILENRTSDIHLSFNGYLQSHEFVSKIMKESEAIFIPL